MKLENLVDQNIFNLIKFKSSTSSETLKIEYNENDGLLKATKGDSSLTFDIGFTSRIFAKNNSIIDTIAPLSAVAAASYDTSNNKFVVYDVNNSSESGSRSVIGVTTSSISPSSSGYVVTKGIVKNVNTSSYVGGDLLWLGDTVGSLTTTVPKVPKFTTFIGIVLHVGTTDGIIYVDPKYIERLGGLSDVVISSPESLYPLVYTGTNFQVSSRMKQPVTTQPNTTYEFSTADSGSIVLFSNSSAVTATVSSNTALTIGERIDVIQSGTGQLTISGSGVTINGTPGLKTRAQYSAASIICTAANTYIVVGDLSV